MNRVRMLIHFGVKPYIVFDGDYLPSKSGTEKERAARRKESKKTGLELLRVGKTSQAHLELQKSVDVTPEMARQLIDELKKAKVDYVVAPFEADSQLAYLEKLGIIDGVLSEDSDLLVFGVKCLVTKLDQYGDCIEINRKDFTACREVSLVGWSDAEFRWMAILSGCDYLPGIDKMGLKTAYRLVRKHKTVDRVIRAVQFDGKIKVPAGYLDAFRKAELTFLHQWVYCPVGKSLVNLTEPEEDVDVNSLECIGKKDEAHIAIKVAEGWLHPHSKQPLISPVMPRRDARPLARAVQETPDLKKHHSIESFFKPKRTPLAELDPNSFTPSPSQQRLLQQQQQVSWSAEPINSRLPASSALTDIPRSQIQPGRRVVSDAWPLAAAKSPKRQRLCSDNSLALAMSSSKPATTATSRFFSRSTMDSPSARKRYKADRVGNEKINIWSDDSIEDAMSQLPETSTGPPLQRKKKLGIFKDEVTPAALKSDRAVDESQDTTTTLASPRESMNSTPATSIASVSQEVSNGAPKSVFGSSLSADMNALREKYSFTAARESVRAGISTAPTAKSADIIEAEIVPCSSPPRTAEDDNSTSNETIDDLAWLAMEARPLAPLSLVDDLAGPKRSTMGKGSEDLLVADSEEEEDLYTKPSFKLDMGRFAFSG